MSEPIEPYACSLGTVVAHDAGSYIIATSDGRVIGIPANGVPSPESVEADIANPPLPISPVPDEISRARFLIALRRRFGLTEGSVYALISAMPEGDEQEDARDLFENATVFRRANGFLLTVATAAGKTAEDLDDLFRLGAALPLGD